jgi:hypothetical protein
MPEHNNVPSRQLISDLVKDAQPVWASAYLEPEDSALSASSAAIEYNLKLATTLLNPLDSLIENYSMHRRTATVLCVGIGAWALRVHGETPSKFFLLWNEGSLLRAPDHVRQCQLPADLGSGICDAWEKVLLQTRYPEEPGSTRCDGVYYHFGFRSTRRNMAGKTWSPSEETHPGKLAALARALRAYGKRNLQSDPQIIRKIEEHVHWLLTREPRLGYNMLRIDLGKGSP